MSIFLAHNDLTSHSQGLYMDKEMSGSWHLSEEESQNSQTCEIKNNALLTLIQIRFRSPALNRGNLVIPLPKHEELDQNSLFFVEKYSDDFVAIAD
jgi:hypothetical protein